MQENWKPFPDYEEIYAVSDQGRLARTSTYGENPRPVWKIMKPRPKKRGYMVAHVCKDGKDKDVLMHRAVWRAFCDEIPDGMEINHKNGITSDNRLENLEIVTRSENSIHAFRILGRKPTYRTHYGSQQGNAKLTENDIPRIIELHNSGLKYTEIAPMFNVSAVLIGLVVRRKTWRHVNVATS